MDKATMEEIWRSEKIVNYHEVVVWDRILQGPLNGYMPVAVKRPKPPRKKKA